LKSAAELEKQAFCCCFTAQLTLVKGAARGCAGLDSSSLVAIVGAWRGLPNFPGGCSYTVRMNSEVIERLETKIAFLESANVELSDVIYRQQQQIQELRARLDALTQQVLAAQTVEPPRSVEDERPPHY